MKFNSIEFLVYLVAVFFLVWQTSKHVKRSNFILLVASYLFYGWWDYRFLGLMFFSSLVDYLVGYYMPSAKNKKALVAVSLVVNLGLLMFFKYFNFFIESTGDLLANFGVSSSLQTLNIILPVGISFYTFQTISYSLDVYKGKTKPETNFVAFLAYVSFFPQLVAGPIERAANFLPQFKKERVFNYTQAVEGMRLFLYGFFKKMVIADNIGLRVDAIFASTEELSGLSYFLGGSLFFIQLYADFSAYTDIARGVAKMLGFELMENFRTPLFSRSIPEFWSRWHISLTTWFRDYFFIWLAKIYRNSTFWRILSTIILFLVIGFWHGANYTFIIFGLLMGLFYIPRLLARKNKGLRDTLHFINNNPIVSKVAILLNFLLLSLLGSLFRSPDITKASAHYSSMFQNGGVELSSFTAEILPLAFLFLVYEWLMKDKKHPFDVSGFKPIWRKALYVILIVSTLLYGYFGKEPFYYFQF